jgi:2TM domain
VFVPIQVILFVLWIAVDARFPWFAFPLLGWGMLLAVHGVYAFVMKTPEEIMIERAARPEQRSGMTAQG